MSAASEQLLAKLGLDTSGFTASLKSAESSFGRFAKGAAGMLGGAVSVAGLAGAISKLVEYGTRIQNLTDRYNVNAASLQRLGNAAELNGSSLEGVAKAFNKLEISESRALGGSDKVIKSFNALGITLDDLREMKPEDIMSKVGKSSMNAADMVTIFGKSALELRPVLAGLADGTIEYGKAIDAIDIQKLKDADDYWRKMWQTITIGSASGLSSSMTALQDVGTNARRIFQSIGESGTAAFKALNAAAHFDFTEAIQQSKKLSDVQWELSASLAWTGGDKSNPKKKRKFGPGTEADPGPSKSEQESEQKDSDRNKLSLNDLAEHGPDFARRGSGGGYAQAGGTFEMIAAAHQAQLVKQLEEQAHRVNLTGISPTGESSANLMSRADAIRQTLPIKAEEKNVGIFRQILDSWKGTTYLETIAEEMKDE
jgi:hypothetical protein